MFEYLIFKTNWHFIMNDKRSLQDIHAPKSICFGCGPLNENGLKIKSYKYKNGLRMRFHPKKEHQAFPGVLNGGIIGTLFDCHGNWTAAMSIFESNNQKQFPATVTAFFEVQLLKPTRIDTKIEIFSQTVTSSKNKAKVELELFSKNDICAKSIGVFVSVKEGHPAFYRW